MSNETLFRKSSLNRISSPEQLNDYVRVSNPGVWMILIAIVALLIGACVWGVFGRLDTTVRAAAVSRGGIITCYVTEEDVGSIKTGMTVELGGSSFEITDVPVSPVEISSQIDSYALHIGDLEVGEWIYPVTANGALKEGTYEAIIVIESVSPMSFILN